MRYKLKSLEDKRIACRATFERFGSKPGWTGKEETTVLFKDITRADTGKSLCDHLWFNLTLGFLRLGLQIGDVVEFSARVDGYVKGYQGRREDVYHPEEEDYRLTYPTKIRKVQSAPMTEQEKTEGG